MNISNFVSLVGVCIFVGISLKKLSYIDCYNEYPPSEYK